VDLPFAGARRSVGGQVVVRFEAGDGGVGKGPRIGVERVDRAGWGRKKKARSREPPSRIELL
jgi:hypothetical protein